MNENPDEQHPVSHQGDSATSAALATNSAFVERLRSCVVRARSARAFADKAGVPPSTLHSYLSGVEPQRHVLISLAKAAGVTAGWLAEGADNRGPGAAPSADGSFDFSIFRKNVRYMLHRSDTDPDDFAGLVHSTPGRLIELTKDGVPSLSELVNFRNILGSIEQLLFRSIEADVEKHSTQDLIQPKRPGLDVNSLLRWSQVQEEIISLAGTDAIEWLVQADDSMEPTLTKGDIAIAVRAPHLSGQGLYLMRHGTKSFVCRATNLQDGRCVLSYDNPRYKTTNETLFDPSKQSVLGPLIMRITRFHPARE